MCSGKVFALHLLQVGESLIDHCHVLGLRKWSSYCFILNGGDRLNSRLNGWLGKGGLDLNLVQHESVPLRQLSYSWNLHHGRLSLHGSCGLGLSKGQSLFSSSIDSNGLLSGLDQLLLFLQCQSNLSGKLRLYLHLAMHLGKSFLDGRLLYRGFLDGLRLHSRLLIGNSRLGCLQCFLQVLDSLGVVFHLIHRILERVFKSVQSFMVNFLLFKDQLKFLLKLCISIFMGLFGSPESPGSFLIVLSITYLFLISFILRILRCTLN